MTHSRSGNMYDVCWQRSCDAPSRSLPNDFGRPIGTVETVDSGLGLSVHIQFSDSARSLLRRMDG